MVTERKTTAKAVRLVVWFALAGVLVLGMALPATGQTGTLAATQSATQAATQSATLPTVRKIPVDWMAFISAISPDGKTLAIAAV